MGFVVINAACCAFNFWIFLSVKKWWALAGAIYCGVAAIYCALTP